MTTKIISYTFFFCLFFNRNLNSQNNWVIEAAANVLIPKATSIALSRNPNYFHDNSYNLVVHPKLSFGLKASIGYESTLKNYKSSRITIPILLSCRFISEKNVSQGEYIQGFSGKYFNGQTKFKSYMNIISLSSGVGYYFINNREKEYHIEVQGSINTLVHTTSQMNETPTNCSYCSSGTSKISYSDITLFSSVNIKLAKNFNLAKILVCPFIAYNVNMFYKKPYDKFSLDYKLNNPLYNLTSFYYFVEPGIKIKI